MPGGVSPELGTRKNRVVRDWGGAARTALMSPDHNGHAVGLFQAVFWAVCPGSSGFQAESSHAFAAFVEDQPVEVVGQVA